MRPVFKRLDYCLQLGTLNDLWRYDGVYWTWMDGTDTISVNAQHSTTPPHPGSRYKVII